MARRAEIGSVRSAFTLAELVIVVLIIGILAAAGGPRFADSLEYFRADAAAKRVKLDLDLAKREAKMASANRTVTFNTGTNSYVLAGVGGLNHKSSTYAVELDDTNYSATLVSASFNGDAVVVYNGFGVPDSAGTVVVQSGDHTRTVTLSSTGGVTIQ